MSEFPYSQILIGSKITGIKRICDLVMLTFESVEGKKIFFHIQCFIRIFENDNLIICTQDMLRRSVTLKKKQKFDWSKPGYTLFDDTIIEYKEKLLSASVKKIKCIDKDLIFVFNNDIKMEVLIHITESDDPKYSENYRIFDEDEDKEHFTV